MTQGAATAAALYRDQKRFVRRALMRFGLRDPQLDDAVQDVFLVAHRRLGCLRGDVDPRAWLFGIARRVASDGRRSRRRHRRLTPYEDERAGRDGATVDTVARRELRDRVLLVLGELSPTVWETYLWNACDGMSASEITEATGANINTVYYRIARARQHVLARVGPQ
jgi:RNA polymerase sigma-70 factor, ECF subfamily